MHWTQHDKGWLNDIYDNAGATSVHLASSVVGFIGSVSLGRRLLRVSEIDRCSVALESPSNTLIGYFLVLMGLIANLLHSLDFGIYQIDIFDSILVTNSMMAIGGAILTFIALHSCSRGDRFGYWNTVRCLQSTVSALVALSFGVEYYLPSVAFLIGVITSALFYSTSILMDYTYLEDSCNIFATHGISAIAGAVLLPLLCKWSALGEGATLLTRLSKAGKQLVYCMIIVAFCAAIFTPVFILLKATHLLRSKAEINNHERALRLKQKEKSKWYYRLFRKRSTFPLTKPTSGNHPSTFVILEKRGSEQRRTWISKRNKSRRMSFLTFD